MDAQGYTGDYIRGVKRNIYSFLIFLDECGIGAYDKITANHIMQHIDKNYASVCVGRLRTVALPHCLVYAAFLVSAILTGLLRLH